jgi:asparagine synthase (glutamine-hydrolysing)
MCGIAGFNFEDRELLKKMMDSLSHRGPDQRGGIIYNNFSLGHLRLSIIDLSENGRQPMSNEEGNLWVVYNGEIYNFKEIKEDLEKKGHRFKSNTDSEVIVHAYEEYGPDCVNLFNGMFAFAIWDGKKLFLARDPVGIKPLYYYFDDKNFIFASEIKTILKADIKVKVDYDSVDKLLSYRVVPGDKTLFEGINKLLPGYSLTYEDGKLSYNKYTRFEKNTENWNDKILVRQFRYLFEKSVERRLIADVPLGAFLSGGLDSSCVVGMMSKLKSEVKTFTAGFNEEHDEMHYAKKIANHFGTEHHEVYIDYEDMTNKFDDIVYHMDEPIADPAVFPVHFVSTLAKEKIKVALFGEGADELFAGYDKYRILNSRFNPLKKYLQTDRIFTNDKQKVFFQGSDVDFVMERYFKGNWNLNNALNFDFKEILPNFQLMKVDKMTMMNSIEGRVPFLDKEIVDFAFRLPLGLKLNDKYGKYIIRKAMKDLVPKEILFGEKRVFFTPLKKWFDSGLRNFAIDKLDKSELFDRGNLFKLINKEKTSFRRYKYSNQLWSLLMIESWFKQFIGKVDFDGKKDYRKILEKQSP